MEERVRPSIFRPFSELALEAVREPLELRDRTFGTQEFDTIKTQLFKKLQKESGVRYHAINFLIDTMLIPDAQQKKIYSLPQQKLDTLANELTEQQLINAIKNRKKVYTTIREEYETPSKVLESNFNAIYDKIQSEGLLPPRNNRPPMRFQIVDPLVFPPQVPESQAEYLPMLALGRIFTTNKEYIQQLYDHENIHHLQGRFGSLEDMRSKKNSFKFLKDGFEGSFSSYSYVYPFLREEFAMLMQTYFSEIRNGQPPVLFNSENIRDFAKKIPRELKYHPKLLGILANVCEIVPFSEVVQTFFNEDPNNNRLPSFTSRVDNNYLAKRLQGVQKGLFASPQYRDTLYNLLT